MVNDIRNSFWALQKLTYTAFARPKAESCYVVYYIISVQVCGINLRFLLLVAGVL